RQVRGAEGTLGDRTHLALHELHALEAELMQRARIAVDRRRRADERAIAARAMRVRRYADRSAGLRHVLVREEVAVPAERRIDRAGDERIEGRAEGCGSRRGVSERRAVER